jgi:polyisoprenoid-binding protein YceI
MARYEIVPDRSRVWIDARSNVHPIHSTSDGLEGWVELSPDGTGGLDPAVTPAGSLRLPVSRLSSGNRLEDRELHKRIDARRFPTIDGVLTAMAPDGPAGAFRVSGDLTFRGVTRRCEDRMTVRVVDHRTVELAGSSTFDIRDFGMQPPRILLLRVEPTVEVRVAIVALKDR